jgi:hypothetical protein
VIWSGKVPQPNKDKKFLLVVSSGHAIRGTQFQDKLMEVEGTLCVGGARYYEYVWKEK